MSEPPPTPVRVDADAPTRTDRPFERAEMASLEDQRRAYRLLEASHAGFWERNLRTGDTWYSRRFCRLLRIDPAHQPTLEQVHLLLHPDDRALVDQRHAAAARELGSFRYDVRYRLPDGSYRWARATGRVWPDQDGVATWLLGMIVDVHQERSALLELEHLASRFKRMVDSSSEAFFERDTRLGSFTMNPRINELLGHPEGTPAPDEATYLGWVHPEDLPLLRQAIAHYSRTPGSWELEYRLRHVDGEYRHFRSRGRSEREADGSMRLTGMLDDVHEHKSALHELQRHRAGLERLVDERTAKLESALAEARQQREQAEQADAAKSRFLAHMSHEIRTPLNGVIGMTELAMRAAASEQQRRHLKLAMQSGRTLMRLLNDVLDFSRVAAGGTPPRDEPFDLQDAMIEPLRSVMPQAREHGVQVLFDAMGDISRVRGDAGRLQQIVTNLLSNAARFTERGHIELVLETKPDGDGRCLARLHVRDTGPGMPPEVAARIFDPFVQGDDSLTRRHGGSGLGLAIALGLTHSMGGELMLETAPGQGSTFTLELPLAVQPGAQPASRRPPAGVAWLAYNHTMPAHWLTRRLERLGWRTEIVAGLPGLARRGESLHSGGQPPDLVVIDEATLDAGSPLMELRSLLPTTRIALMVRPDWSQPQLEPAARAAGMQLVIAPVTKAALIDVLEAKPPAPMPGDSGYLDLPFLPDLGVDVLIAEDNPVNQIIVSEMIDSLGLKARLSSDGDEVIRACRERPPALVLMDLQMPVMDGLQATRELRRLQAEGQLPEFPIVALTAHATPQDRDSCIEAGMVGFLTKPVALGALRGEISRWLTL